MCTCELDTSQAGRHIAGPARVRRRLGACHGGRTGHNLAKTGSSPLNGPIMRQTEAYQAIFCTLKTTLSFIGLMGERGRLV